MEFYLRIEGVNLNNFVFDTADLSTIRGGSLLLLEAINQINAYFEQLKAVSTGASSGLFQFKAANPQEAQIIKNQVRDFLFHQSKRRQSGKPDKATGYANWFKHATFVIDILPVTENAFDLDRERLLMLNRWQQMQSPTGVFPGKVEEPFKEHPVCDIDLVRPTHQQMPQKQPVDFYSESVYQRRRYGQKLKYNFYREELKKIPPEKQLFNLDLLPRFVQDLEGLTKGEEWGNLHGKMAVIYLDGNSFGKIQQGLNREQLQVFDETIKAYRRLFLHDLLMDIVLESNTGWLTQDGKLRLEILLWGGDELMLVVPAWQGWWTLNFFFKASKDWCFQETQLTHAAGLVFCHHNAPIYRIKDIAYNLANFTKDKSRDASHVAYQVLESFNETGDIKAFLERRLGSSTLKAEDLIIAEKQMKELQKLMVAAKGTLSKNRVYRIVELLLNQSTDEEGLNQQIAALMDIDLPYLPEKSFWLHLIELWDYITLSKTDTIPKKG
jgi:hypothetical protein